MSEFVLSIFDPNTLLPHRAGIAGLALALSALKSEDAPLTWEVTEDEVQLAWDCCDREAIQWLMQQTYIIQDGLLVAPALRLPKLNRYSFSKGVLDTFLQFSSGNKSFIQEQQQLIYAIEDIEVSIQNRPLEWCYYTDPSKLFSAFTSKGSFKSKIKLTSKHLPGLIQDFATGKCYEEYPVYFVALLFLPIACSYFQLDWVRHPDSKKKSKVPTYAIVLPDVRNLIAWKIRRQELAGRICRDSRASGIGEAGLRFLLQEKIFNRLENDKIRSCEIYKIGPQQWDTSQMGLKQAVYRVSDEDIDLELYESAYYLFPPQEQKSDDGKTWISTSKILSFISENIVARKPWYKGFYKFRKANQLYERKGLVTMTEDHLTPDERILFDAVQGSFRTYLRGKGQQATKQGRRLDYGQVTDKVIYRFQRPSTQQEFATTLVDFLSQHHRSKALKAVGPQIYHWIHREANWRQARDLALLAVATYQGKAKSDGPEDKVVDPNPVDGNESTADQAYEYAL